MQKCDEASRPQMTMRRTLQRAFPIEEAPPDIQREIGRLLAMLSSSAARPHPRQPDALERRLRLRVEGAA
jgi:hypothetical protein